MTPPPAWATSLNGINNDPNWSGTGGGWGFGVVQQQVSGTKSGVITVYPDGRPTTVTENTEVETWKRPVGTYYDLWDDVRRQNGGTLLSDGPLGYGAEFAGIPGGNPNWNVFPTTIGELFAAGTGSGGGLGLGRGTDLGNSLLELLKRDWLPWVAVLLLILILNKKRKSGGK